MTRLLARRPEFAATLRCSSMRPIGCLMVDPGKTRRIDKGFRQHRADPEIGLQNAEKTACQQRQRTAWQPGMHTQSKTRNRLVVNGVCLVMAGGVSGCENGHI